MLTQRDLAQFTGTEEWYRYNPILFKNVLLTDETKYVAQEAGAYWLMDIIASVQPKLKGIRTSKGIDTTFQVWEMTVIDSKGYIKCTDGNEKVLYTQEIPYTDFPLKEIKLYASDDGVNIIILLPSEY